MNLPFWEGWHLIGAFPDGDVDDVGSWLLCHGGEALLLEIPPGLAAKHVRSALRCTESRLCLATASHDHEDHLDDDTWIALARAFPDVRFLHPRSVEGDVLLQIGDEPIWLIKAPKHSPTDVVTIFRGVAMTGDIELGMLASVNKEVPLRTKKRSMAWLRDFEVRTGYGVHTTVSAHLNDVRAGVNWAGLFAAED